MSGKTTLDTTLDNPLAHVWIFFRTTCEFGVFLFHLRQSSQAHAMFHSVVMGLGASGANFVNRSVNELHVAWICSGMGQFRVLVSR